MTRPGPSKTWVFIEESPYSIDDGFFALDPRDATKWYNSPAVLHGTSSVLAYGDGHSAVRQWTDTSMINEKPATPSGTTDNWPASTWFGGPGMVYFCDHGSDELKNRLTGGSASLVLIARFPSTSQAEVL